MLKLKALLESEKMRSLGKKIFTKKKIGATLVAVVLIGGLRIGYSLMYDIKGIVSKVDTKSIVITNFLGTKTVNTGNYPIDSNKVVVGQRIEILKNLSGDVISIKNMSENQGRGLGRDGQFAEGQNGFNRQGRHNDKALRGQAQNQRGVQNPQNQNGQGPPAINNGQGIKNQQSQNGQDTQNGIPKQGPVDGVSSASVK